jgi:hypothetical protein
MIGNVPELITYLVTQDREKIFELKEHKKKRTLSQNAYAWKLINELGNKLNISKEDLYKQMLQDYGQSIIVSLLDEINPEHYFKYYKQIGKGKTNGKGFNHYRVYKGSSEFNTLEMKYFLDGIIQECQNVGIPTLTPNEIERMKLV